MTRQSLRLISTGLVALALCLTRSALMAQPSGVVGTLSVVWADWQDGRPASTHTFVTSDRGDTREVLLNDDDVLRLGGIAALDGQRVRVTLASAGPETRPGVAVAASVAAETLPTATSREPRVSRPTGPRAVTGSVRYLVLLCRYTDSTLRVNDPVRHYATLMGNAYPGLDHYWRDVSLGYIDLSGTRVQGWFDMPGAWNDYWNSAGQMLAIDRVAQDCSTAADPQVDFSQFDGVVFITPGPQGRLPGPALGGGTSIVVEGVRRGVRAAWIPFEVCGSVGCYGLDVVAHEIGHSLGLPHSSGPYGSVYDSGWDVMSGSRFRKCVSGSAWWCIGPGTIGYHKSLLGWIPAARELDVPLGTTGAELLPLDTLPATGSGIILAKVPVPGTATFYTVEARRPAGYDEMLPRRSVIIHHVDPSRNRAPGVNPAWVVDGTNTDPARDPNDDEAMWTSGEAFIDAANGILVDIIGETAEGWRVAFTRQTPGLPLARTDAYSTGVGVSLSVPAPGILANDHTGNSTTLTASLVSAPLHGQLTLQTTGGFTYAPSAGFAGTDAFTYIATGTGGSSGATTVQLTVSAGPQPASGLVVRSVAGNTVTLQWTPPVSGDTPTGYSLEGGVTPGQILASVPTGSAAPMLTFNAPTGAFYLRIKTIAGAQTSGPSNEIRVFVNQPVEPSAPTGLAGLVNGQQVALSWRNTFGGGTPSGVILDVGGALSASLPLGLTDSFTFNGVPGGTYTFSVRAVNGSGSSPSSNPVTLTFPGPCSGAPAVPENFLTYNVGNTMHLLWDPAANGPATTGFVLNVSGAFTGTFPLPTRGLSAAVPPGAYTFTLSAVNPCGASAPTAAQTVVVP